MGSTTLEGLAGQVLVRYGSLEEPDFSFVGPAYESDPYRVVRDALQSDFDVKDVTDLNMDVCVAYDLAGRTGARWFLQLSLVGPYATLTRFGVPMSEVFVDSPDDVRDPEEAQIVGACRSAGCELLSRDLLNQPISLRLFYTEPERVRLYQALFSDVDRLPGEV